MNKIPSTILGLAIGDALGQPFEFSDTKKIIESGWKGEMKGSSYGFKGMWNLERGQWTDDTLMARALSESLLEKDGFYPDHVAGKYIEWVESGDLRGIGGRTQSSIYNMMRGVPPMEASKKGAGRPKPSFKRLGKASRQLQESGLHGMGDFCGNGTVMRCAPIGLFFHHRDDANLLIKAAEDDATMTHDHMDARDASRFLALMVSHLASGIDPEDSLETLLSGKFEGTHVLLAIKEALALLEEKHEQPFIEGIKLGVRGTAHETLASALYCFLAYPNFKEAVTASVLVAGDADTRSAICGALAGTHYGISGIPEEWIEQVEDSEKLQEIDRKLYDRQNS